MSSTKAKKWRKPFDKINVYVIKIKTFSANRQKRL